MSENNVITLDTTRRPARGGDDQRVMTERWLRGRQATLQMDECHAACHRLSYQIRTKTRRFTLFHNLSVGFPKGRRIALLGHKGSGKTALFELLLKERPPTRGRVIVNSRLSWPVHSVKYFDARLTVRQNVIFVSHVLGVDAGRLLTAVQRFCQIDRRQTEEPLSSLPVMIKRRLGIIIVLAADFDCLLIDNPLKGQMFGFSGDEASEFEQRILSTDYIAAVTMPRQMPPNCDLVYLLYDGRLYMYEDVDEAVRVYRTLPEPEAPGGMGQRSNDRDDDDSDQREEGL